MFPGISVRSWALIFAFAVSSFAFAQSSKEPAADPRNGSHDAKNNDEDAAFHGPAINDINAIGRRNVGCNRGLANWYTLEKQVALGRQVALQVDAASRLITDPKVVEYVNRLGQNLVRNSDARIPLTIKVLDDDSPNASTLAGGQMYVNTGAILAAETESELAGVMAHEIGHVSACHAARQATRATMLELVSIPVSIAVGPLANQGLNLLLPAAYLKFSRNFEEQADYLGIQYAYKAGYDPVGMLNFFEKIEAMEKKKKGVIARAYATHPQTPDRLQKSQHEIETILPPREQYVVDNSEFQETKTRLAAILNLRRLQEDKSNHPTLRRAGNDPGKDPEQPKDDEHPTLKRHAVGGE
ncbi:MAG TPA: M48 family metallopeptidase [Candidatus Saccharimonadales bacterium]|jgi:predicted Zn-dependent protease|nr:M48 family metallopeptidase [Candidatus Saccharimonadales bacterium]